MFFSWFLTYGFYGAVLPRLEGGGTWLFGLVVTVILVMPAYFFWGGGASQGEKYLWQFEVKPIDLVGLIIGFFALLIIGYDGMSRSLFADEIAYAQSAHGHGFTLAAFISKWPFLGSIKFKYTLQLFSFLAVLFLFFVWRLTKNFSNRALCIFLILFFICRLAFMFRGGNGNPHPPLELLPLLVSGAAFGINELGLRLVGLACYMLYLYMIYRMVHRKCDAYVAFAVASIIGSMPLALEMMAVIEHAFWAYVIFTLVLFELATSSKVDYGRLVVLISIGTLLRQSVFVALVPVLIMYILELRRERDACKFNFRDAQLFVPVIIFAPFLLQSIFIGTPATPSLGGGLMNLGLYEALSSGVVAESFNRTFHLIWLIPILYCFIPLNRDWIKLHGSLIIFSLILLLIYYSIEKGLWGLSKYQAEYALPFISLGVFFIALRLRFIGKSRFVLLLSAMVMLSNVLTYEYRSRTNHWPNSVTIDFNYKDPYKKIRELGLASNNISLGPTYGVFPEVINDYTHAEIIRASEIYQDYKSELAECGSAATSCVSLLGADRRIKSVLIQGNTQGEFFYRKLLENGWVEDGQFCGAQKACVFLLHKS
jgi:hypothetical protein